MLRKTGIIIINFIKSSKKTELIEVLLLPVVFTIILYLFFNDKITDFTKFANSFNDSVISIAALLSAFGLAAVSILITSSSNNINVADKLITKRFDRNKKPVSYYKLQIIRSFTSLIIQIILLIIAIVFKFLFGSCLDIKMMFYIEVCVLLISIMLQIFSVVSMYYLFSKIKEKIG